MKVGLTILATAAILLPAAAVAQDMQPTTTAPATPKSAPGPATWGQEQTTPGNASDLTPAAKGSTPSGQTSTKAEATTKVTKADVKAGASIFDTSGNSVGKVESISAKGAVVNTGKVKVTVPISSLAKSDKGLVIAMTKSQIEAAAKKSS
ncbi:MAG TPA: hypothetical protein VE820_10605 [Sphingomicrobium sp.]|nr:hypothetical protein [Sphingomicrobium sp.]